MSNKDSNVQEPEADDFISFSDSPQKNNFQPQDYSSPQKHWEPRTNYKKTWNSRRFSGNNTYLSPNNRSFNSPYNKWQNNSSNQSWNNSNRSFNSSKNSSRGEANIHSYLHPSFMENPWSRLEQQLEKANTSEIGTQEGSSDSECNSSVTVEV